MLPSMGNADWVRRAAVVALAVCAPLLPLSETAHFCADGIHPEGGACKVIAAETAKRIESAAIHP